MNLFFYFSDLQTVNEMSSAASRVFQAVKAHMPMIKFRKGSLIAKPAVPESTFTPVVAAMPVISTEPGKWNPDQVVNLEWWQTPTKFKRRNVDDSEIDII